MIFHILSYEWKMHFRKPERWGMALAFFALIGISITLGTKKVESVEQIINRETVETQQEWAQVAQDLEEIEQFPERTPEERNPQVPYELGGRQAAHHAFKHPDPLAALSLGHSELFAYSYPVSVSNTQLFSPMMEDQRLSHPLTHIFPTLDLAFVLIWLLPFWLIASLFQIRSWEDEHGTLTLLRSQPMGLGNLLFIKVLFQCVFIAGVTIASIGIFALIHGLPFDGMGQHWLTLCALIMGYIGFWGLVSLGVNRLRLSSMTNAGLLFTAWLTLVLVIPAMVHIKADQAFPLPSRMELVHEMRETEVALSKNIQTEMNDFYMAHPELAPKDDQQKMPYWHYQLALKQQRAAEIYSPIIQSYYSQSWDQVEWLDGWKFASPALLFQRQLNKISGNAHEDFLTFQQDTDQANEVWRGIFFRKIFRDEWMTSREFTSLPNFSRPEAIDKPQSQEGRSSLSKR